jgi:hypothetical protein
MPHDPLHTCHPPDHVHGPDCGHPALRHGDHVCYLVGDHLHWPEDGRCEHHGPPPGPAPQPG